MLCCTLPSPHDEEGDCAKESMQMKSFKSIRNGENRTNKQFPSWGEKALLLLPERGAFRQGRELEVGGGPGGGEHTWGLEEKGDVQALGLVSRMHPGEHVRSRVAKVAWGQIWRVGVPGRVRPLVQNSPLLIKIRDLGLKLGFTLVSFNSAYWLGLSTYGRHSKHCVYVTEDGEHCIYKIHEIMY